MFDGADDCIVVSVVVKDRTDGAGEENVLPSPPPLPPALNVPPTVPVVPVFDGAVSELTVSGFVDKVGAVDLLLMVGACWSSLETGRDTLLCERDALLTLRPDGGVQKERWFGALLGIEAFFFGFPEIG